MFKGSADYTIIVRQQKISYAAVVAFVRSAEEPCAAALRNVRIAEKERCGRVSELCGRKIQIPLS